MFFRIALFVNYKLASIFMCVFFRFLYSRVYLLVHLFIYLFQYVWFVFFQQLVYSLCKYFNASIHLWYIPLLFQLLVSLPEHLCAHFAKCLVASTIFLIDWSTSTLSAHRMPLFVHFVMSFLYIHVAIKLCRRAGNESCQHFQYHQKVRSINHSDLTPFSFYI